MNKLFLVVLFNSVLLILVFGYRCDRRPYGATTQASPADGRFRLIVVDAEDTYLPEQLYTVKLCETDGTSRFTSFMISAEGDLRPDPKNPRRMVVMNPGEIRPQSSSSARFSDRCLYSVEHVMSATKSSIEVYWQAPPSGNGCVIIRAMVAENEASWFEDGGPLTQRLCEDMRQPDDVAPQVNYDCKVCDEAKYEISFSGIWSRNTHPVLYPENDWVPRYSDLVGASHAADYILWTPGTLATDGLKDLAEHANSSKLETEILGKIGEGVRTLIKAKGHKYPTMNNPSYSFVRVDKINHLVTTAVAIYPSPDWFLGVTRFDLCSSDNTWLLERELNLYPWDAGTDSGVSYESANIETFPQDAVSRVQMSSYDKNSPFYEIDMKELHPFGKLHIKLIRTYHRECAEDTGEGETGEGEGGNQALESSSEPEEPSRYQTQLDGDHGREGPIVVDPESPEDCPMSQWQEWSECDGPCEDGNLKGYKWRERYHLVDGIPVEKYDPDMKSSFKKVVSKYCKTKYDDFEEIECEAECSESNNEVSVQRRVMEKIAPGHAWKSKKRDTPHPKFNETG